MPRTRLELMDFLQKVGVCFAVLILIHLLPKEKEPENTMRLYYTLTYFGALMALLYNLLQPREQLLLAFLNEKYKDYPDQLKRAAQGFGIGLNRLLTSVIRLLIGVVACVAILVLGDPVLPWISGLDSIHGLTRIAYYGLLATLLLFPILRGGLVGETSQLWSRLHSETERFDIETRDGTAGKPPVTGGDSLQVREGGKFTAGQIDWNWELLCQNVMVLGQTGSGKTICVLNTLLEAAMATWNKNVDTRCAGLVLDPKGDFDGKLEKLSARLGRSEDFVRIDPQNPSSPHRWNPLDSDDDELELAERFAAIMDAKNAEHSKGEAFWVDAAKKFIRHAIHLLRLTNPPGDPPSFWQLNALVNNQGDIADRIDSIEDLDALKDDGFLNYFANEWMKVSPELRTSVQSHITNMLDPFLMPPYREAFSGKSTVRIPDVVDQGKILYVYMPVAEKEAMSKVICTFAKLEYFREVLRRPDKKRPSFFFCDEFQVYFTTIQGKGDADFFERSRQSRHVNIIASQNLQALYKQSPKKEAVLNLIGNCASKIFLQNTEDETNEFASKLFGEQLIGQIGMSYGQSGGGGKMGGFGPSASGSVQDQRERVVRPERFAKLASPSRESKITVAETVVHIASFHDKVNPRYHYRWKVHPL